MLDLGPADRTQLARRGVDETEVARQAALLRTPPAPARLVRPAVLGDGIRPRFADDERRDLLAHHAEAAAAGRLTKMVPASGAASRMFRALTAVREGDGGRRDQAAVATVQARFADFAFAGRATQADTAQADTAQADTAFEDAAALLDHLLTASGLDLARCPKGLIDFHRYPGEHPDRRTAFVEHLIEGLAYVRDAEGRCRFHFTVASDHEAAFRAALDQARRHFEKRLGVAFEVTFSTQSPATDTVALDPATNRLVRRSRGGLLFRPGGHGALLANLQALGGDIVLIKNIDNVLPADRQPLVVTWQRLLTGLLVALQDQTFAWLARLASHGTSPDVLDGARDFATGQLNVAPSAVPSRTRAQQDLLIDQLDRPLRVCAMVRNEGEPGGGPFWVEDADGRTALQIVEGAQIDQEDAAQAAIQAASTHFNPVALVCGVRNHRGEPFDLHRFVDPRSAFVANKSHAGQPLRALEHPGLWNGAMARWNTIFVDVPAATFAPVKTVLDLLRPEHQPPSSVPAAVPVHGHAEG